MTQPLYVEIEIPPVTEIVMTVPGPQGPPGLQNVYVGPTAPDNPELNTIWIETA